MCGAQKPRQEDLKSTGIIVFLTKNVGAGGSRRRYKFCELMTYVKNLIGIYLLPLTFFILFDIIIFGTKS